MGLPEIDFGVPNWIKSREVIEQMAWDPVGRMIPRKTEEPLIGGGFFET